MNLFELKNVKKIYPDGTKAVRGVSFSIKKGEFVAIMGPSGSGKSTLLHILGFLDRHTSGTYRFTGKTIDDYSGEEIARVRNENMGFIFQSFNLLRRATILENVMLPLLYADNVPPEKREGLARHAIEQVGLSHRIAHESAQLSGGERQRVAIARALVNTPDVIFADEPTGNLDSASGKVVMELIQKLNENGHTIVLITHETYTAEHAERVIKILDGVIESDRKVIKRNNARNNFKK